MPRIDRNRSLVIPYRPNPPPEPSSTPQQITRAAWEEFTRIAAALADLDNAVSIEVSATDSVNVAASASFTRMLDNSPTIEVDNPGGTFAPLTGIWTCPADGLYLVTVNGEVAAMNAPAQKSYTAQIRRTWTHAAGGADTIATYNGGGLDDQVVSVIGTRLLPMLQGDTLRYDVAAIHPTKIGTVSMTSVFYAIRQAGLGNAN